jgi:hypothetical protein
MSAQRAYRMRLVSGSLVDPDERLDAFYRYWRSRCGGRSMPSRADIDPIDIPPRLLPNLFLIDVVDGGARFRYRLVGTDVVGTLGWDPTGGFVDEINQSPPYRDYIMALYRRIVGSRLPSFSMSHYPRPARPDGGYHATQRLMCPLSADGVAVDKVFACQIFQIAPRELEFPRLTGVNPFVGVCEADLEPEAGPPSGAATGR